MNRNTCQGCPIDECHLQLDTLCNYCDDIEEWLEEHDKQIRTKVIDDFLNNISESIIWDVLAEVMKRNIDANDGADKIINHLRKVAEKLKEQVWNKCE